MDSFNFGQKKCPKVKRSKMFKRPKFNASENFTVQENHAGKLKQTLYDKRKDLEMTGIVKAVTKKNRIRWSFQNSC